MRCQLFAGLTDYPRVQNLSIGKSTYSFCAEEACPELHLGPLLSLILVEHPEA